MAPFAALLGRAIRRHRRAAGLSQEEAGHRGGLHAVNAGMVERGERNVTAAALVRIGRALGVRASTILAEAEDEPGADGQGGGAGVR